MQLVSYSNGPVAKETFSILEVKTRKALACKDFFYSVVEANDIDNQVYDNKSDDYNIKIDKLTSHLMKHFSSRFAQNEERYKNLDGFFGSYDRVTFSFPKEYLESGVDHCRYYGYVKELLDNKGYELVDYIRGICEKDNREFKIGKILARFTSNKDIINGFANSPVRAGNKKNLQITVSRNLYDIITMSTFKGWTSCMNILKGSMNYKIDSDLDNGTLVVYIYDEKISDMDKASARFLLKPFFNTEQSHMVLYNPEDNAYGSISFKQNKIGNILADKINKTLPLPTNDITKYSLGYGLYNDGMRSDFFYKNTDWDFTIEHHVKLINSEEISNINLNLEEIVRNHPNNKILLQNSLFYSGFDRKITSEDIDYLLSKDIKINNFAINYVNSAKNPHFDKEFALLIKDYFSPQKLFKFMIEKSSLTEKLSIDDGLFSGEDNKSYIDMINLRISSNFSEMRELSRIEMQILINIYFSYEIKSDALSCSYMKTLMKYKLNNERVPYRYSFRLNTDIISTIEEAFTYEEQCTLVECLDDGYFWVSNYYKFLSKFLILEKVYYRGVMESRYFKEYCENEVPMFKEAIDFNLRKHQSDYGFDTTIALAS